LIVDGFEDKE
jgi:hypothetical protein